MVGMLVVAGALGGLWAGIRGIRLLARGLAHADEDRSSLDVIRGIRGLAVAVGTAALAGGVLLEQTWLLAFGLVFLLEELYETGVVALVLRGAQTPERDPACRGRGALPPSFLAVLGGRVAGGGIGGASSRGPAAEQVEQCCRDRQCDGAEDEAGRAEQRKPTDDREEHRQGMEP